MQIWFSSVKYGKMVSVNYCTVSALKLLAFNIFDKLLFSKKQRDVNRGGLQKKVTISKL